MATDYATLKKGGWMRQKQKNNFSLRVRVVGGNLTATQLAKIAEVAEKYGEGYAHLTSRQSVEIPFIKLENVEDVKAALAEGGVEPGVCGPRVRTITACQGEAVCPSGCIDTYALAKELDDRYFARELPHKFKFGVTGCQNNCLKAEENDVGIKGAIKVKWLEDKCIGCGLCAKTCRKGAIKVENKKVIFDESQCAVAATSRARRMPGKIPTATSCPLAGFSATTSTRAKRLSPSSKTSKSCSISAMRPSRSLPRTRNPVNASSTPSTASVATCLRRKSWKRVSSVKK